MAPVIVAERVHLRFCRRLAGIVLADHRLAHVGSLAFAVGDVIDAFLLDGEGAGEEGVVVLVVVEEADGVGGAAPACYPAEGVADGGAGDVGYEEGEGEDGE